MEKNGELSQKYLDEFISSGYANRSVAAVYLSGKVVLKDAARAKFVLECAIKNGSANASRLFRNLENELK